MTDLSKEDEFDTKHETAQVTGPAQGDVLVVENDFDGQVSEIDITGEDSQAFRVEARDTDSQNPTSKTNYVGSDIKRGSFDNPEAKFGAQREVAVRAVTSLTSGSEYAVNLRVDERRA